MGRENRRGSLRFTALRFTGAFALYIVVKLVELFVLFQLNYSRSSPLDGESCSVVNC
jgi:hypothetical protein